MEIPNGNIQSEGRRAAFGKRSGISRNFIRGGMGYHGCTGNYNERGIE
jgi:hypothetical protein